MNRDELIDTRMIRSGHMRKVRDVNGNIIPFAQGWSVWRGGVRLPDLWVGKTAAGVLYGLHGTRVVVTARHPSATSRAVAFGVYRRTYGDGPPRKPRVEG